MFPNDFFRINLPYGMKRNSKNEWMAFNRVYSPIGWKRPEPVKTIYEDSVFSNVPVYHKYNGLNDESILKIIKDKDLIERDENGTIYFVYFYKDNTNPNTSPEFWNDYFEKLKAFSKFDIIE